MDNLKKQMLNQPPPKVGRGQAPQLPRDQMVSQDPLSKPQPYQSPREQSAAIARHITPRELEMIKLWEDIDNRSNTGWGTGGKTKERRVQPSDILKAEAIIKARQRMMQSMVDQKEKEDNWNNPELPQSNKAKTLNSPHEVVKPRQIKTS